ncbi:MAG: DUF4388 domain-containing protein [Thiomargarita sp.]|nr:DUF4388 domain-containing protein [Thiomargarita sp.]
MNIGHTLPYPTLMAEIQHLSEERKTGTIFITSDSGHLIRIVLNEGEITCLVFNTKYRGYDAIPHIQNIKSGRLQFAEGVFEASQEVPLPPTAEIFETFYTDTEALTTQTPSNIRNIITHVKITLASYVGPIATIICDEYIDKMGKPQSIVEILIMVETIALEIDEPIEAGYFKQKIKEDILTLV